MTERDTMTHRETEPQGSEPGPIAQPREELSFADPPVVGSAQPAGIVGLDGPPPLAQPAQGTRGAKVRIGDRLFYWLTAGSGGFVIILIALVAVFLVSRAAPVIAKDKANFLFSRGFQVASSPLRFGVADLLWVTVISSAIALLLAVPVAIGIALFITQYAPKRLRRPVGYIIDLLAAIPSIIYGIWGIYVLAPHLVGVQKALYHLHFIPLFQDKGVQNGTIFDASVVLAVMILPIITAISRDVFERTPRVNIEAAWALGATRWEVIRLAVLPYGRPGVVSGAMLGLGRALGETIAVMLILSKPSQNAKFSFSIFDGGQTFASLIGLNMQEANGATQTGAYIAAGLVLFILTFAVNAAARAVVNRRREFS
jgi:phosphate transport system permease protein